MACAVFSRPFQVPMRARRQYPRTTLERGDWPEDAVKSSARSIRNGPQPSWRDSPKATFYHYIFNIVAL
jgi:hypothetical protein